MSWAEAEQRAVSEVWGVENRGRVGGSASERDLAEERERIYVEEYQEFMKTEILRDPTLKQDVARIRKLQEFFRSDFIRRTHEQQRGPDGKVSGSD